MRLKKLFTILVMSLFLLPVTPVMAEEATVDEILKELVCPNCGRTDCSGWVARAAPLIKQKLAEGQSKEQILEFFVTQYGERVLAAFPKRGFNLVAWFLPLVAILGGGGVVYILLRRWVRQGRQSQTRPIAEDEEYKRRLEKELEEFSERSFR